MPGLDGLRAIAVLAVIAYHLGSTWAPGGLLGVGVFFTLSGYLITDILLRQVASGGIQFKNFWLARARRLLPALFAMLPHRHRLDDRVRPSPAAGLPNGRANRGGLLQQLVAHLPRRFVLREVRGAWSPQPFVVALDRRAVLHRLAVHPPRGVEASFRRRAGHERSAPSPCPRNPGSCDRFGSPDDCALQARHRPLARLLRDGHARASNCWSGLHSR